jgi:RNA polymerase sigma factor for flagellar operon FliA
LQRLQHRLGRAPRAKELADDLGWTLSEFHRCMADAGCGPIRCSDHPPESDVEQRLETDTLDAPPAAIDELADPLYLLQHRQRQAALRDACATLDERPRHVMEMVYQHGASLREIGLTLGVSESRVCQIHAAAVAKLKLRLSAW